MIKILRNILLITIHLFINLIFFIYRIIHVFLEKNKGDIKKILVSLDNEVKKVIETWWIDIKRVN